MLNPESDILFPPRSIHSLAAERGQIWKDLVALVESAGPNSLDQTAFILMLARLSGCATCNSDSFRSINGCATCARLALKRYRGSDEEIQALFESARDEVERYIQKKGQK